jgi:PmbA protein
MLSPEHAQSRVADVVARAMRGGASAADAILVADSSLSLSVRLGNLEDISRSEGFDLGLRVFKGQRVSQVSSSDWSERGLAALVERVLAMAEAAPEDPFASLADAEALAAAPFADLELYDAPEPSESELKAACLAAEEAGRAVAGVTNSEGAGAGATESVVAIATSHGFAGSYRTTGRSVSMSAVAGQGTAMERDYAYSSARRYADLDAPAQIGREAGERAVRRLNPRKLESAKLPVVFDPRVSNSLLGHFSGAISGTSIARKTSFLLDALGKLVFAPGIAIIDDPLQRRGLRSKPFDGEGVRVTRQTIVEDGQLTTWLLDTSSAKQLGLRTTGHATRGISGPPGPSATNLYMAAGTQSPAALIAPIKRGLYVTELIGMGVNGVTGDYSRGATGFLIEDGVIGPPVSEITIASNLKDMFAQLTPANDLEFKYGINAPTLLIGEMMVAGD